MSEPLPRGIWYDAPNRRYRVRRYKNRKPFLVGYFDTLEEARVAHQDLDTKLQTIPQRKRGERTEAVVPCARFGSLARFALASID